MKTAQALPPEVIRYLNETLALSGKRICRACQGHPLPLDADHFPRDGRGGYRYDCKPCYAALMRANYAADPAAREASNIASRRNYYANREARLARQRAYAVAHADAVKRAKCAHYLRNRDAILRQKRREHAQNPALRQQRNQGYHARKKAKRLAAVLARTVQP